MIAKKAFRYFVLSFLLRIGYFLVVCEWLIFLAMYLPIIFDSAPGRLLPKGTAPPAPTAPTPVAEPPAAIVIVLGVALSVFVVALVVYVLIMRYIPTTTKVAQTIVKKAAQQAVPLVAHKPIEHVPPKRRQRLTARIVWWLKLCVAVLPVVGVGVLYVRTHTIGRQLAVGFEAGLAVFALLAFTIQALLVRRWHSKAAQFE